MPIKERSTHPAKTHAPGPGQSPKPRPRQRAAAPTVIPTSTAARRLQRLLWLFGAD